MIDIKSLVLGSVVASTACLASAATLTCEAGNPALERRFNGVVATLHSRRHSLEEEEYILATLDEAIKGRCHQAAVILADIKMIVFLDPKHRIKNPQRDQIEAAVYELFKAANLLDEGWFEMGMLLADRHGLHFDPAAAKAALNRAKEPGDARADEFMLIYPVMSAPDARDRYGRSLGASKRPERTEDIHDR